MELYATLETILTTAQPTEKIERFKELYAAYGRGEVTRDSDAPAVVFESPSYRDFCTVIDPKEVPRRTKLSTPHGQTLLLHAIAHIEYSAIDLALDAVYRFRECGEEFEHDWLVVAEDEVRHFEMIEGLLKELGAITANIPCMTHCSKPPCGHSICWSGWRWYPAISKRTVWMPPLRS